MGIYLMELVVSAVVRYASFLWFAEMKNLSWLDTNSSKL